MPHSMPDPTPADQAWFWTPAWQDGERQAGEQIAAGGLHVYDDMAALFADLDDAALTVGGTGYGKTSPATALLGGMPGQGKSNVLWHLTVPTAPATADPSANPLAGLRPLISVEQAAEIMGFSRASAYRYVKAGQMPSRRLGGRVYVLTAGLRALLTPDTPAEAGDPA